MNSDDDNSPPIDRRRSGRGRKSKSLQLSMVLAEELAEQLAGEFDDSPGEDAPPPQLLSTVSECDDPPKEVPATRSLVSSSYQGHSIHNISSTYLANDDEDLLSRTISDVGLHAFGAIFVELWVVSSDGRHMKRPSGGHWMNPSFAQSVRPPSRALDVNNHAPDCAPGESLAGTLFKESFRLGRTTGKRKVHWRQIKSLIDDPFIQQGPGRRMEQIHDLGIGLVATVPFTFQGRHGIVLYMSRSTANLERLRAEENENYLVGATDLIGASFAIRIPRARCARVRKEVFRSAVEKVKKEIRSKKGQNFFSVSVQEENDESRLPNDDNDDDAGDNEGNYSSIRDIPETWRRTATTFEAYSQLASYHLQNYTKYITRLLQNSVRKYRGAGLHGPPRQSLAEAVAVFTGVFVVMLSLLRAQGRLQGYSEAWSSNGDKEAWSFDASWYTSSLCIIFALSAAPVGQPRQIVLAHIWCICVGVVFQQIPTGGVTNWLEFSQIPKDERIPGLPLFWRQAMSTAIGISGQAYFGILHPPASSMAYTFATNEKWKIRNILPVILGDLIMITMSVVILNLGEKQQYPMFWFGMSWKFPNGRKLITERAVIPKLRRKKSKKSSQRSSLGNSWHPSELHTHGSKYEDV